ncbi:PepSY domain-containing protein [Amorphus sp. MBR-141]
MKRFRTFLLALSLSIAAVQTAAAACLSPGEQRDAVQSGAAVRPAAVQGQVQGELVRLDLCQDGGRLVYVATVLMPGGQVDRVVFDARSGARQ